MAKRKKGMTFIPYDYEAAYNKSLEDMHEFFVEQMFKQGKKVVYALKEIRAGDQFEVEIYPQFKKMDEVPPEGRSIKKDNDKAQRNLNDKNARKYVERLINENFTDGDLWLTFTYDNEHLPPDGDIDAAIKNVQKFIRRVNYQRKKRGLPNARYVYVTAYNPTEEIRWHHHIVMDGDMDMDVVEGCWKQSSRNEVRRLALPFLSFSFFLIINKKERSRGVETSILSTCNNYKPRWKSNGVFFNRFFGGFVLRATLKSNFVASAMSCSIIEISLLRL